MKSPKTMISTFASGLTLAILGSFATPAIPQDKPAERPASYPFTIDPSCIYEYPELTVEHRDLRLNTGPVLVVPMSCERGITGAVLIGNGEFRYTPEKDKLIQGQFRAAMLRFNPEEQSAIVPLEKGKKVTDRGAAEMSRHMLQVVVRHCWQSSSVVGGVRKQEVLIPPKGAFAAVLYSKEHGDLLISGDERTAMVYNFTEREQLYEKR